MTTRPTPKRLAKLRSNPASCMASAHVAEVFAEVDALTAALTAARAESAELRRKLDEAERSPRPDEVVPQRCPITGEPFFMLITNPQGEWVPTYGGPYDSYTIPETNSDGSMSRERYDHDEGAWVEGCETISQRIVDGDKRDEETAELRDACARMKDKAQVALNDAALARQELAELRRKLDAVVGLFPREGSGEVLVRCRPVEVAGDRLSLGSAAKTAIVTLPPELRGEKASEP